MATRSEQARADAQRKGRGGDKKQPSEPKKLSRAKRHAAKKATFALEEGSRKSSRKSANRAKPESTLEIREEFQRNTPQQRHDRAAARQR
jgi:hypothetical protein